MTFKELNLSLSVYTIYDEFIIIVKGYFDFIELYSEIYKEVNDEFWELLIVYL